MRGCILVWMEIQWLDIQPLADWFFSIITLDLVQAPQTSFWRVTTGMRLFVTQPLIVLLWRYQMFNSHYNARATLPVSAKHDGCAVDQFCCLSLLSVVQRGSVLLHVCRRADMQGLWYDYCISLNKTFHKPAALADSVAQARQRTKEASSCNSSGSRDIILLSSFHESATSLVSVMIS